MARPVGSYEPTSVRSRLLDLLSTLNGEWMDLTQLEREYSERFGPVKVDTLRVSLYRAIRGKTDGKAFVRLVERPVPAQKALEVLFVCEEENDEWR